MAVSGNIFLNQPGTPSDPTFLEVLVRGHAVEADGSSQQFINQLHFAKVGSVGAPTNLTSFYNLFEPFMSTVLSTALSVTYVPDNCTIRPIDSPIVLPSVFINTVTGVQAGDRLPTFNATVTRKYTYGRGRSYRGSNHWGPIAESDTTLDQLTAGAQARWDAVAAALAAFVGAVDTDLNGWTLFVLSPTLSTLTTNPSLISGALIRTCTANAVIGTMKRRKQGVGV